MKISSKPIITENEEKLFILLNTYKYLDVEFIQKYFYKDSTNAYVYKRLQQLEYNHYIKSEDIYEFRKQKNNIKEINVTRKIIMNSTLANEFLKLNEQHIQSVRNAHLHYIKHQLELAKAMHKFENAYINYDENEVEVVKILNESECSLSTDEINIRPDLGMIVSINDTNTLYFIEMEKRYATHEEVRRKMIYQYSNFEKYKSKLEILNDYDVRNIRILFVSSDLNKKNNLIKKVKKYSSEIKFDVLFTTSKELEMHEIISNNILNLEYDTLFDNRVLLFKKIENKENNE